MSQTTLVPERPLMFDGNLAKGSVEIAATRPRQTTPPATPFRDFLAGSVSVLMGGAEIATHVLGAPTLAAAVQTARGQATSAIVGSPFTSGPNILASVAATSAAVSPSALTAAAGTASPAAAPLGGAAASAPQTALASMTGGSDASDMATMQAMQRENHACNMQLLGLQEQVQQDSQRFTTISNVMRAKQDTAKAAISNIRA